MLDLGCAGGYVAALLEERKGCRVTAVDACRSEHTGLVSEFLLHDLDAGPPQLDFREFDFVLLLDVIEHLRSPEAFVEGAAGCGEAVRRAPSCS